MNLYISKIYTLAIINAILKTIASNFFSFLLFLLESTVYTSQQHHKQGFQHDSVQRQHLLTFGQIGQEQVQVHLQLQQEGHDGNPNLQLLGKVQHFPKPQLSLQQCDFGQGQQQLHFGNEQLMDGRQLLQLQELHGLQSQQHGNFTSQQQQQQQIQERLKQGMPLQIKVTHVIHDSYLIRLLL